MAKKEDDHAQAFEKGVDAEKLDSIRRQHRDRTVQQLQGYEAEQESTAESGVYQP